MGNAEVFRLVAPLPPATKMPKSAPQALAASCMAPQVTVVTPLLCQSKPSTQPNACNHQGSESRRSISAGPNSSTMAIVTAPANCVIRLNNQGGALPVCNGNWAIRRLIPPSLQGCFGDSVAVISPSLKALSPAFSSARLRR